MKNGARVIRRTITPVEGIQPSIRAKDYLPGEPNTPLNSKTSIGVCLEAELATRDLDQLTPWLSVKQDSSHISPLTHQLARGREIVITEKPGLRLV